MKIEIQHVGGMAFRGTLGRHELVMDTSTLGGQDTGPTPKQLLLSSVLGCTGMDVVALLRKYRQDVSAFSVIGEGEFTETHPKVFRDILVTYDIKGQNLNVSQVQEAVDESLTKYCGVSAMVFKTSPIRYRIRINGEEVASGHAAFSIETAPNPKT